MKRYIYYFMIIGLLPVFSCTDGLDLYPNDKVTVDNYWNTAEDALRAVNATYSNTFPQSDTYGCDLLFLDAASDNTYPQHSNQFGNFQQIALNAFEANHAALQELWNRRYVTIRRCADFLVNIGNVNMDPILKNRYTAEVLFQRAYAYYYLIAQFGDVPWVDHPLTIQEASSIRRTDKYAIAKQIISDLDYAAANLPSSYTNEEDDGRVTRWAAFALKSRICMFMAGDYRKSSPDQKWYWEQARDATDSVITKSGKCCKTYMLYVVYQYNIISCVLSKKQDRNKINNLSDSSLFTFHLVSSFALGCTKMFFKPFSPTTSRSSENILLKRIDELLQPKEKMSKSISSDYIRRNFYYPQR